MATFNPYNRAVKESINVDSKDRHSPQKVILCNRENKFFGEFIGKVRTSDVEISGGVLTDVTLSNAVICDKNGVLDLSGISQKLTEIDAVLDVDVPAISSMAETNASSIQELCSAINSQGGECSELSQKIEWNKKDIGRLSVRLSVAEDDIDEIQDFHERTFISSLQDTDYGREKVPGFLVLKD